MEVLIVDHDLPFSRRLAKNLTALGHQSIWYGCSARGRQAAFQGRHDLLIINIERTGDAGSQLIERFSQAHPTPVIATSTNADLATKIHHLNIGAVDYVVKPVDFEEFMARVSLQLGRRMPPPEIASKLVFDDLLIDLANASVQRAGRSIRLTKQEFALLLYLARHAGQPVSRQTLFEQVWKQPHEHQPNVINVAMGRLRRKIDAPLERKFLHTVHGVGYVAHYRD